MKINLGNAVSLRPHDDFPGLVVHNAPIHWTISLSVGALKYAIYVGLRRL